MAVFRRRSVDTRDQGGRTPLFYAAQEDDLAKVRRLISAGADVNAVDDAENTALQFAARAGAVSCLRALIDAGAQVDAPTKLGMTALGLAVASPQGRGEGIRVLLAAGADPWHEAKSGATPVNLAERLGYGLPRYFVDAGVLPATEENVREPVPPRSTEDVVAGIAPEPVEPAPGTTVPAGEAMAVSVAGGSGEHPVGADTDVAGLVRRLHQRSGTPAMLTLSPPDGPFLRIGIGSVTSVVDWEDEQADIAVLEIGDPKATGEPLTFDGTVRPEVYPAWAAVPFELAVARLVEYAQERRRPTAGAWSAW